jgi:hypothetical protein
MRTLLALTLTLSLMPAAAMAKSNSDNISASQVTEGFRISPVPEASLKFKGGQRGLVGLGSYIVNASGACSGCHSYPEFLAAAPGDPFNGLPSAQSLKTITVANYNVLHYLAGGQCFGPFMARNITPDSDSGLPADLTEANFIAMMRTGEDFECENDKSDPICAIEPPTPVLQVMPWPAYHNLTDRDLKAVYAYLSALPNAQPCNTPADGCPGFSGTAASSASYTYANTTDCPNPALSQ